MSKDLTIDLTDKQIFFCKEYIIDLNATQAAIRAGYSEDSASVEGSRLLTNAKVQNYVQHIKDQRSKRLEITADRIAAELSKIAFSDVRNIFGPDGQLIPIKQIDDETAGAISSVKSYENKVSDQEDGEQVVQGINREVKMHDKMKALELLGKHMGFFERDNDQKKPVINTGLQPDELSQVLDKINSAPITKDGVS